MNKNEKTVEQYLHELNLKADRIIKMQENTISNQDIPKYLTVNEACKELHISKRTLFNYKSNGYIDFSQIGRKIYISKQSIDQFMQRNHFQSFTNPKNKKS